MHLIRQRISKLLYSCTPVPLLIVPALSNLGCLGVEVSIQFRRWHHHQSSRCLLLRVRSCIVKRLTDVSRSPAISASYLVSRSQTLTRKSGYARLRLTGHIYCAESANTTRLSPILVLLRGLGTGPSLAACTEESSSSLFRASAQASVVVPHRRERFLPRN